MSLNIESDFIDKILETVRPRWYIYPNLQIGEEPAYDADAEYCDMEAAADQLAEAYIKHNNARIKCENLVVPEARTCRVCLAEYNDWYYVWKLSVRVKRFE